MAQGSEKEGKEEGRGKEGGMKKGRKGGRGRGRREEEDGFGDSKSIAACMPWAT
jgi:hypothetical protein